MKDHQAPSARAIVTPAISSLNATLRQWQSSALLDPAVLEPLHELNRGYLELLAGSEWRDADDTDAAVRQLAAGVEALDCEQRAKVADCPFSLFSANFYDGALWAALASTRPSQETAPAGAVAAKGETSDRLQPISAFAEMVFFFAWHLVRSNPLAARVFLGMNEEVLTCFRSITLSRLRQLAEEKPYLIKPRWPERRSFWQALLRLAGQVGGRSEELRLIGIQMLAAEGSSVPVRSMRRLPEE